MRCFEKPSSSELDCEDCQDSNATRVAALQGGQRIHVHVSHHRETSIAAAPRTEPRLMTDPGHAHSVASAARQPYPRSATPRRLFRSPPHAHSCCTHPLSSWPTCAPWASCRGCCPGPRRRCASGTSRTSRGSSQPSGAPVQTCAAARAARGRSAAASGWSARRRRRSAAPPSTRPPRHRRPRRGASHSCPQSGAAHPARPCRTWARPPRRWVGRGCGGRRSAARRAKLHPWSTCPSS